MNNNCWLPKLECYDGNCDWREYQETIYEIFKHDFLESYPIFDNKRVNVKHYPIQYGKEESFFHVTCKDYVGSGERVPDLRRCERIRWIRAFIENYNCDSSKCIKCDGIKIWEEPYKSKMRIHFLLEEERYVVVLERRDGYYLLITAFYLDYENGLEKQLKHYEKYKI